MVEEAANYPFPRIAAYFQDRIVRYKCSFADTWIKYIYIYIYIYMCVAVVIYIDAAFL